MYLNRKCLPFVHKWTRMVVHGRGLLTQGTWGPGPAVNLGRGQEERVTCADTQGRWPRSTLPPGAPVCESADIDRGTGCRCSGCSSCSLDGGCAHPRKPTLLQDSAGQRGCPFSPLVISPSPTWTLPPRLRCDHCLFKATPRRSIFPFKENHFCCFVT